MRHKLYLLGIALIACFSIVALSCGGNDGLNDFVHHIITGYTPFDRIVANDQIRIGFVKARDGNFIFNRFLTGSVSVPTEAASDVHFSLRTEDVSKLSVNVKSIISAGLDYADIDSSSVHAKGIRIFSFPAGYLVHLPRVGPEFNPEGDIITDIARIDSLFVEVVYKSGFGGAAKIDSEMHVVQSGLSFGRKTDRSFTIVSVNRPIAYHLEKINPSNIIYDSNTVVLYGRVDAATELHPAISIEYSNGFHPVEAEVNPLGWYSVSVPVTGLARVHLMGAADNELMHEDFVPGIFEYNFRIN
ncbi:MAG TPA: hypothetical protein VLY03_08130 [Bacteroidota bacterium]|nr:hypothetical protein [Bacteroidota bacterium]